MEQRTSPLVYDESILRHFYHTIIEGMQNKEVSISLLASRSKYMTDEQKETIRRGDSAVLSRTVVKYDDVDKFVSRIHRLSAESSYMLSYDGKYLPNNSFVIYTKVNPSDAIKASDNYVNEILKAKSELIDIYETDSNAKDKLDSVLNRLKKSDGLLYREIQCSTSRRRFIDIDVDVKDYNLTAKETANNLMYSSKITVNGLVHDIVYYPNIVRTRGGFHLLLNVEDMKKFNRSVGSLLTKNQKEYILTPDRYIEFIKSKVADIKEITVNQEAMVPLPGTLQGGYKVTFV